MFDRSDEMINNHRFDLAKIRFPAVLGHRVFTRTFERELGSSCHDSNPVCQIRYTSTYMYKCQRTHGLPSGNSDEREMRKTEVKIILLLLVRNVKYWYLYEM